MKPLALAIVFLYASSVVLAQEIVSDKGHELVEAAGDANAENVAGGLAGAQLPLRNVFGIDFRNLVAAKRFQLTQVFLVEVDEIMSVCRLDRDQVTRLTIGARGAVRKLQAEWEARLLSQMGLLAGNNAAVRAAFEEARNAVAQTGFAIHDAKEIDETTMQYLRIDFPGGAFVSRPATESPFWENTVHSVLTETQTIKLDDYRQERVVAKRQAAIAMCMTTLEYELGLNDEQKPRLLALVVPEVEEIRINCSPINEMHLIYYFISRIDADDQPDNVLSPAQSQKLKMFLAPHRNIFREIELVVEKEKFQVEQLQTRDLPNQPKGIN